MGKKNNEKRKGDKCGCDKCDRKKKCGCDDDRRKDPCCCRAIVIIRADQILDTVGLPFTEGGNAGFVISEEGRYVLCGNVNWVAGNANDVAIRIDADEVDLDLNQFFVEQVGPFPAALPQEDGTIGIQVAAGHNRVRIHDGWVTGFGAMGVRFEENQQNIIVERVKALRNGGRGTRPVAPGVAVTNRAVGGISVAGTAGPGGARSRNIKISDCIANDNVSTQFGSPPAPGAPAANTTLGLGISTSECDNVLVINCQASGNKGSDTGRGIQCSQSNNAVVDNCVTNENAGGEGSAGISLAPSFQGSSIVNCQAYGNRNLSPEELGFVNLLAMQTAGLGVILARTSAGIANSDGSDFIFYNNQTGGTTSYIPGKIPRAVVVQRARKFVIRNNTDVGSRHSEPDLDGNSFGVSYEHRPAALGGDHSSLWQDNTSHGSDVAFYMFGSSGNKLRDLTLIQNTAYGSTFDDLLLVQVEDAHLVKNNFGTTSSA